MDDIKIPILVVEHCLCHGCNNKFNKLKEDIPQVHSIEFNTEQGKATIFGAVDPTTVMEELAEKGITPKILWEKSSPINNQNHSVPSLHQQPVQQQPDQQPVQSLHQQPVQSLRQQPIQSLRPTKPDQQPVQSLRQQPIRSLRRQPDQQPVQSLRPQPGQSLRRQPDQQPVQSLRPQPGQSLRPQPGQSLRRQPDQQPVQSLRQQPGQSLRPQPGQSLRRQPDQQPVQALRQQSVQSLRRQSDQQPVQSLHQQPVQPFRQQFVHSLCEHQNVPSLHQQVTHAESAGIRIQDESIESIVNETSDCYLNHEHELVEVKGFNKRFTCDGCKEDGFKSRYRCERCNFDLHYECRFPKITISPEIHEELVFEFRPQPPTEKLCDACGKEIHGYFYNCKVKGMDLHPCCARLKAQARNHDMVLLLCKKVSSECLWCRKKQPPGTEQGIPGWCYVSQCKEYNIHILCITQMMHQAWQRGLMDGTRENSIRNINFQRMAVSDGNRGGRGTEVALKIIGILRTVVGILLGDPSVFFGKLMFEFLEQLL